MNVRFGEGFLMRVAAERSGFARPRPALPPQAGSRGGLGSVYGESVQSVGAVSANNPLSTHRKTSRQNVAPRMNGGNAKAAPQCWRWRPMAAKVKEFRSGPLCKISTRTDCGPRWKFSQGGSRGRLGSGYGECTDLKSMLNARYRHHCRASGFIHGPEVSLCEF